MAFGRGVRRQQRGLWKRACEGNGYWSSVKLSEVEAFHDLTVRASIEDIENTWKNECLNLEILCICFIPILDVDITSNQHMPLFLNL